MEKRKLRPIAWTHAQYFVCPFVAHESFNRFYCLLCNTIIDSTRVLIIHIQGQYHKSLLDYYGRYITPLENDLYFCEVCDCVIPRYTNVNYHLNARRHYFQMQRFKERTEYQITIDYKTRANEFYNRLQEIMKKINPTDFVRANAISSNEDCNRLEEIRREKRAINEPITTVNEIDNDCIHLEKKSEGKVATNNVKTKANENSNDCSYLEEKRQEKRAIDNAKTIFNEINNDFSHFEKKREEKDATNNVKAKANESSNDNPKTQVNKINNDDFIHFEKIREEKVATNNVKAKANESDNDCRRLEERTQEKTRTVSKEAKPHENNEYNRLENKREKKMAENHVKANANDITDNKKINSSPQSEKSSFFCSPNDNFVLMPITPEVNEFFQYCSTDSSYKKILEETAYKNSSNDTSSTYDSGIGEYTLTTPSPPPKKIVEPINAENVSTPTYYQEFVDLLDFQSDMYDPQNRLKETRFSMDLCMQTERGQIYCLVCHQIVANASEICVEHLCSFELCDYRENLLKNPGNSYEFAGEFGHLNLASQYMECFSAELINCLVCKSQVRNIDLAIKTHVLENTHCIKMKEMRAKMRKIVEKISSRWLFDWYKIQKYSCTSCSEKFEFEFEFVKHLNTEKHTDALKRVKDFGRTFVYDFCDICAVFWCGYRDTYASHCDSRLHKWFVRNGERVASKLPESAQEFLDKLESQSDDFIDCINSLCAKEEINKMELLKSLGNLQLEFPWTQGCAFGSRISSHCVINVFLGCAALNAISAEKMNDGRIFTEDDILWYMMSVKGWMSEKPEIWNLKPLATGGRSPIISAIHKSTGIACDISFDNGLVIGGLKFIDAFNDMFPSGCKLMNCLNHWLVHCKLNGPQHISSYVLYWLLVFYLQNESILPSVVVLTQTIDGLQVGGSNNFVNKIANNNVRLKKILIGFFKFYANFNFRYDVVCPLVGKVVKKRSFAYPENLPIEMGFYVAHVMYANNPQEFPVDSPMCIQDPFSLNHNLSIKVSKTDLCNFRTFCAKTAEFLSSS